MGEVLWLVRRGGSGFYISSSKHTSPPKNLTQDVVAKTKWQKCQRGVICGLHKYHCGSSDLLARMFHELLSRDREDGRARTSFNPQSMPARGAGD